MRVIVEGHRAEEVVEMIGKYGIEISGTDPDFIISIGGDGSVVRSYKKHGRPILPVRASYSLNFISDIALDKLEAVCEKLMAGRYHIEKHLLLDLYMNDERLCSVMNEVTLDLKEPRKAMRFDVYCNGERLFKSRLIGNGVIIATPLGSTGYNESVGGYVIDPKCGRIVVTLNATIGIKLKKERSRKVEEDSVMGLKLFRPEEVWLSADGYGLFTMRSSDEVYVKKSRESLELIKIDGTKESWNKKIRRRKMWLRETTSVI